MPLEGRMFFHRPHESSCIWRTDTASCMACRASRTGVVRRSRRLRGFQTSRIRPLGCLNNLGRERGLRRGSRGCRWRRGTQLGLRRWQCWQRGAGTATTFSGLDSRTCAQWREYIGKCDVGCPGRAVGRGRTHWGCRRALLSERASGAVVKHDP